MFAEEANIKYVVPFVARHFFLEKNAAVEENELTQEILSQIFSLHELGVSEEAIQINIEKSCNTKVSIHLIKTLIEKTDLTIKEWLDLLKLSIANVV